MRDGYWLNYGKCPTQSYHVREHELWMRAPGNAKQLGVPKSIIKSCSKFMPVRDRDKFLLYVMRHAPVMRIRGHGSFVTFEYARRSPCPLKVILQWAIENAGPYTTLNIVNLATGENVIMQFQDFRDTMDRGGAKAVMRAASVNKRLKVRTSIAKA